MTIIKWLMLYKHVDINLYKDINALFSRCVDLERYMEADEVIIIYKDNEEIIRGNANVLRKLCDIFENTNQKV